MKHTLEIQKLFINAENFSFFLLLSLKWNDWAQQKLNGDVRLSICVHNRNFECDLCHSFVFPLTSNSCVSHSHLWLQFQSFYLKTVNDQPYVIQLIKTLLMDLIVFFDVKKECQWIWSVHSLSPMLCFCHRGK